MIANIQIADGMDYLEKRKIVLRNLCAKKVLVGIYYVCKIADFGVESLMAGINYHYEIVNNIDLPNIVGCGT